MNIILQGIVGSHAYGLARAGSDVDHLGIYAATCAELFGLDGPKETVTKSGPQYTEDITLHEVGKYCRLALQCNPTLLELLWLPPQLIERQNEEGFALREIRFAFLSDQRVRDAYGGYAFQQAEKMRKKHEELLKVFGTEAIDGVQQELLEAGWTRTGLSRVLGDETEGTSRGGPGALQGARSKQSTPDTGGSIQATRQADLRPVNAGVQPPGGQGGLGLPDMYANSGGGGGSLSPDGEGSRPRLSEVQPGDGPLQRRSGVDGERRELAEKWWRLKKNARHCYRLLKQGRELLETGDLTVAVDDPLQYWTFDEMPVQAIVDHFGVEFERFANAKSVLPAHADREKVNDYLVDVRYAWI